MCNWHRFSLSSVTACCYPQEHTHTHTHCSKMIYPSLQQQMQCVPWIQHSREDGGVRFLLYISGSGLDSIVRAKCPRNDSGTWNQLYGGEQQRSHEENSLMHITNILMKIYKCRKVEWRLVLGLEDRNYPELSIKSIENQVNGKSPSWLKNKHEHISHKTSLLFYYHYYKIVR